MRAKSLPSLISFSHQIISTYISSLTGSFFDEKKSLVFVDATCGNGHDTLFLQEQLLNLSNNPSFNNPLRLIAFDIQKNAVENTRLILQQHLSELKRLDIFASKVICDGHENILQYLQADEEVCVAVFNLGYLPGSDKSVITLAEKSLRALEDLSERMTPGGIISAHTYGGHVGGLEEHLAIEDYFSGLLGRHWAVRSFKMSNKIQNPEQLFLAERLSH